MRLVSTFAASGALYEALRGVDLPMTVELADFGEFEVSEEPRLRGAFGSHHGTRDFRIVGERMVDPSGLIMVDDIFSRAGLGPGVLDTVDGDAGLLVEGVNFIVGAISFLTGVPMQVMTSFGDGFRNELVPETEADSERLRELGDSIRADFSRRPQRRRGDRAGRYRRAIDRGAGVAADRERLRGRTRRPKPVGALLQPLEDARVRLPGDR